MSCNDDIPLICIHSHSKIFFYKWENDKKVVSKLFIVVSQPKMPRKYKAVEKNKTSFGTNIDQPAAT